MKSATSHTRWWLTQRGVFWRRSADDFVATGRAGNAVWHNDAIVNDRARTANSVFNKPGVPRFAGGGNKLADQQPQRQR
jgi:hypothetical protein